MRSAMSWWLVILIGAAACKGQPFRPDAGPLDGASPDAMELPWYTPTPGEASNWDIQLAAPFDLSTDRQMMILSLWDVVPSQRAMTYEDGSTVTVPAGVNATAIADLHAKNTTVLCHVNTGAIRLDDPDAMKFPGYATDPPNRPDALAPDSVIGWSTTETGTDERFIDIRTGARATVVPLIAARFDLAKAIGCDGVLTDKNDALAYEQGGGIGHGFGTITVQEHTSWNVEVAALAHAEPRELSVGMHNLAVAGQADELSDDYDWLVIDRCGEFGDCDQTRPFIEKDRAAFGIDFDIDLEGEPLPPAVPCANWNAVDGILKTAALDRSRGTCP